MKNLGMFVVALSLVSGSAMASGFKCTGEGYNVKMFNLTSGATRKPAVLVVSHDDASPKTLLTAKGSVAVIMGILFVIAMIFLFAKK